MKNKICLITVFNESELV